MGHSFVTNNMVVYSKLEQSTLYVSYYSINLNQKLMLQYVNEIFTCPFVWWHISAPHLSDNYVDLSDNYVDLSDNYVDLSDDNVDLSDLFVDLSLVRFLKN
jgi:hypothetical protein